VLPTGEKLKYAASYVARRLVKAADANAGGGLAGGLAGVLAAVLPARLVERQYTPDFKKAFDFFCIHTGELLCINCAYGYARIPTYAALAVAACSRAVCPHCWQREHVYTCSSYFTHPTTALSIHQHIAEQAAGVCCTSVVYECAGSRRKPPAQHRSTWEAHHAY
jgi:hypothetical protein